MRRYYRLHSQYTFSYIAQSVYCYLSNCAVITDDILNLENGESEKLVVGNDVVRENKSSVLELNQEKEMEGSHHSLVVKNTKSKTSVGSTSVTSKKSTVSSVRDRKIITSDGVSSASQRSKSKNKGPRDLKPCIKKSASAIPIKDTTGCKMRFCCFRGED